MTASREPVPVIVVGEDDRHFDVVAALFDRRVRDRLRWTAAEEADLAWVREWVRRGSGEPWHRRSDVIVEWERRRPRARVHSRGSGEEHLLVRKLLVAIADREPAVGLALIARDTDGKAERRKGHETALAQTTVSFAVAFALPEPEIEAWIVALAGRNPDACKLATALQPEIGFDPIHFPHRLTSTNTGSPRDAKRVLARILSDDQVREVLGELTWVSVRGAHAECGLGAFACALDDALERAFSPHELAPR